MKKAYILKQRMMNGTVTIGETNDIFLSRELAEKCQKVLDERNKNMDMFSVWSQIEETEILESEEDCECLKEEKVD